jgi:hypothetical protein
MARGLIGTQMVVELAELSKRVNARMTLVMETLAHLSIVDKT